MRPDYSGTMWFAGRRFGFRWQALGLLLAVSGCEEVDESCPQYDRTYHIEATLRTPNPRLALTSSSDASATEPSGERYRVWVWEDSTITACEGDLVSESTPGATLYNGTKRGAGDTLTIEFPVRSFSASPPTTYFEIFLDLDDDGECGAGDLAGGVVLRQPEDAHVAIELRPDSCPGARL